MRARKLFIALTLGVACVTVVACSSPSASPRETVKPTTNAGTTAIAGSGEVSGDYPSYDAAGLINTATLIVEGTVTDTQPTELTPRFEGDTPEENPHLGLTEEELAEAEASAESVPATMVTFHADVVHAGNIEPNQDISIIQTVGLSDGATYAVDGEVPLEVGKSYLLFAKDGFDGTFVILGGSAGTLLPTEPGKFVAVAPDMAPFSELTREQVQSLLDGIG